MEVWIKILKNPSVKNEEAYVIVGLEVNLTREDVMNEEETKKQWNEQMAEIIEKVFEAIRANRSRQIHVVSN